MPGLLLGTTALHNYFKKRYTLLFVVNGVIYNSKPRYWLAPSVLKFKVKSLDEVWK